MGILPFSIKQEPHFPVPESQVFEEVKLHSFLTSTTNKYGIYGYTSLVMTQLLPVISEFSPKSANSFFSLFLISYQEQNCSFNGIK
jgi:hypothetical protein